jgi:alkyl sulfatase BDS1-like metallo-beta-lactamase superfamily hydrolase
MKSQRFYLLLMVALCPIALYCQTPTLNGTIKAASPFTKDFNTDYSDPKRLNWADKTDFQTSERGFIAGANDALIKDSVILAIDGSGDTVWNFKTWNFLSNPNAEPPSTVNPSLWRMEKLISKAGLFEVVSGRIYQIRSFDLAVMSFIVGDSGYIIIDPLGCPATAKVGHELFHKHVIKKLPSGSLSKNLKAVIYTHSHVDHFGGIYGIISDSLLNPLGFQLPIYAPTNFLEEAVSENVYAGNVMGQRAAYMYGNLLPKNTSSGIGAGLGLTINSSLPTLKKPTITISTADTTIKSIARSGINIEFLYAPNTEAPSEMLFYFPQFHALCAAEDATHTLHNLYSLRGTKTRSARDWVSTLTAVLEKWGSDVQVEFNSHHWPVWSNDAVKSHLETQRAMYKFINDQTLRLANRGYDMTTTAEIINNLPESLNKVWSSQGYYGTVNHNVKATWDLYLGWFDGNPSQLHKLPAIRPDSTLKNGKLTPLDGGSAKYVRYMGGRDKILALASQDFQKGEYRWVAEVVQHLVNLDSSDNQARYLLADALEQMGYQAVSGPWRDFYLTGALELREGRQVQQKEKTRAETFATSTFFISMTSEQIFDWISTMVDPHKADGKTINFAVVIKDGRNSDSTAYQLKYSCLNYLVDSRAALDFRVVIDETELKTIVKGIKTQAELLPKIKDLIQKGGKFVQVIPANTPKLGELFGVLSANTEIFNIVTPNLPMPIPINPMLVKQK